MPNAPRSDNPARAIRVDDELWEQVNAEAERKGITASQVVRLALRATLRTLFLTALVAAWLIPASLAHGGQGHVFAPDMSGSASLMQEHGCWSGPAPADMAGKVPGHVVVTIGERTVYAGSKRVGQALDQTFGGHDHGLLVRGFCR